MAVEQRHQAREPISVPVRWAGGSVGQTQDLSGGGLYFLTDQVLQAGGAIDVEIELDTPEGPARLHARGEVLRVEARGERAGVAVKLSECKLVVLP